MATSNENNGFLYFAVGALLVAVAVLGFAYVDSGEETSNPVTAVVETTENAADEAGDNMEQSTSEFSVDFDEGSFSASSSSEN